MSLTKGRGWLLWLVMACLASSCFPARAASDFGAPQRLPTVSGAVRQGKWTVSISSEKHGEHRWSCLNTRIKIREISRSTVGACGTLAPSPLMVGGSIEGRSRAGSRSVFGIAVPLRVHRVEVWMHGFGPRWIKLRQLSRSAARSLGIRRLRFGGLGFSGRTCVGRVLLFDAKGPIRQPQLRGGCGRAG